MKKYEITKEQILEFVEWGNKADAKKVREEWFPEVFETKLEAGKWYKHFAGGFFFIKELENNRAYCYGLSANNGWYNSSDMTASVLLNRSIEATEQEVKTALENEAVKRGFVKGVFVNPLEDKLSINSFEKENKNKVGSDICFDNGNMYTRGFGKYCIFKNGIWATIIPTLTKKEAEEKLNCKII